MIWETEDAVLLAGGISAVIAFAAGVFAVVHATAWVRAIAVVAVAGAAFVVGAVFEWVAFVTMNSDLCADETSWYFKRLGHMKVYCNE